MTSTFIAGEWQFRLQPQWESNANVACIKENTKRSVLTETDFVYRILLRYTEMNQQMCTCPQRRVRALGRSRDLTARPNTHVDT
jgi:hypothetical protein